MCVSDGLHIKHVNFILLPGDQIMRYTQTVILIQCMKDLPTPYNSLYTQFVFLKVDIVGKI